MRGMSRIFPAAAFVAGIFPPPPGVAEIPPPTVIPAVLPAAGEQQAVLTVGEFGRYAVWAESREGVALQLADRMVGSGPTTGRAGEEDGRLDVFLDAGDVRLITTGDAAARGEARLEVRAFTELHSPPLPLLPEHALITTTLEDFQQRSYWLSLATRQWVALEAAGRSLADLRVWRDGVWLVAEEPEREVVEPRRGQPMLACRLAVELEPGLYQVTAYGGSPRPWGEEGEAEHPFYLRWGIPSLPEAARQRFTVGPFGVERFLLPGTVTYVRLELPEALPAMLGVSDCSEDEPFVPPEVVRKIEKNTVPPAAELPMSERRDGPHCVTVQAEAGQPFVLQHFVQSSEARLRGPGRYWVSSIHAGAPQDSVDATAVVLRRRDQGSEELLVAEDVVVLGRNEGYVGRFNLLGEVTLLVRVLETGRYQALVGETEAQVRFEPFLTNLPRGWEAPPFQAPGLLWELDAGLWVVALRPLRPGVATLVLRHSKAKTPNLENFASSSKRPPVHGAAKFPALELEQFSSYRVILNGQLGVRAGLVVRPLPLDLTSPLPLVLQPSEEVSVDARVGQAGVIRALGEDGDLLEVRTGDGEWSREARVPAGHFPVAVRNPQEGTVVAALSLIPDALLADTPLLPAPDDLLTELPQFPVLTLGEELPLALGRNEERTFLLRISEPGLYRLTSTGLLATTGTLRSRVVSSLVSDTASGVGRNFLIQHYLLPGDYQLTVRAEGRSAGPLGVVVEPAPLRDGGLLEEGVPARVTLADYEGIVYTVSIPERSKYRLRTAGLGVRPTCRLESADGWPLVPPGGLADITRVFEPGTYRLVVLPTSLGGRRVSELERIAPPPERSGHGPHPLRVGERVEHLWRESGSGDALDDDLWGVELPAAATLQFTLSRGMAGEVVAEGSAQPLLHLKGGETVRQALPAGRLQLRVRAAPRNNLLRYTLEIQSEELLAGQRRTLRVPAELSVAVSGQGLVEIFSRGDEDVSATLVDDRGLEIASSDDRPDDWNFLIAEPLPEGRYTMRVKPVGRSSAACRVEMRQLPEVDAAPLALGESRTLPAAEGVYVLPLPPVSADTVVVAAASGGETIGLVLERPDAAGWQAVGQAVGAPARLAAALPASSALRLKVVVSGRRTTDVRVMVSQSTPLVVEEGQLRTGVKVPTARSETSLGALVVPIASPGLLAVRGDGVVAITALGRVAERRSEGVVMAKPPSLWLLAPAGSTVRGERLSLSPDGQELAVAVPPGERVRVKLAAAPPGVWLALARATAGQPMLRLLAGGETASRVDEALAVAPRAALTGWLEERAPTEVEVWDGETRHRPLEVRLRLYRLPPPEAATGAPLLAGELAGGQVIAFPGPAGGGELHLTRAAAVVALVEADGGVRSAHWGPTSQVETMPAPRGRVVLARLPWEPGSWAMRLTPAVAPAVPSAGDITVIRPGAAGVLRLPVRAMPGRRLLIRGAGEGALLVGADGRVQRGDELDLASPGSLWLPHGPDPLLLWTAEAGQGEAGLWGKEVAAAPRPLTLPASVPLDGTEVAARVAVTAPSLVHLRAPGTLLSRLEGVNGGEVQLHLGGVRRDVAVGAGEVVVRLRPVPGWPVAGQVELYTSPLEALGEGLGDEVVLAPGEARGWRLAVTEEGPVGLGVWGERDVVEGKLLDAEGRELGRGVAVMRTLAPSDYVWVIAAPAGGEAVRARPAAVGLVKPGTGPPGEVLQRYLRGDEEAGEGVETSPSETTAEGLAADDEELDDEDDGADWDEDAGSEEEDDDEGGIG